MLVDALAREQALQRRVERRTADIERREAAIKDERLQARKAMPEGVRLMVVGINECLTDDGHAGLRILRAEKFADRELHGVELVERSGDGLETTFYWANRLRLELDRSVGLIRVRLFEGRRHRGGEVFPIDADGLAIEFRDIWGPMWERRLPMLLRVSGDYPSAATEAETRPRLDPITRAGWTERVDNVFRAAKTQLDYSLVRFDHLEDGEFRSALVLAYDAKRLLAQSVEAGRLSIEVDRAAGTVSMLARGGVLRKMGGETTIPDSGYRILLPGLGPAEAVELMLGMVVTRQ